MQIKSAFQHSPTVIHSHIVLQYPQSSLKSWVQTFLEIRTLKSLTLATLDNKQAGTLCLLLLIAKMPDVIVFQMQCHFERGAMWAG